MQPNKTIKSFTTVATKVNDETCKVVVTKIFSNDDSEITTTTYATEKYVEALSKQKVMLQARIDEINSNLAAIS